MVILPRGGKIKVEHREKGTRNATSPTLNTKKPLYKANTLPTEDTLRRDNVEQ